MQAPISPAGPQPQTRPYDLAMAERAPEARPAQGERLAVLRRAAGLTQVAFAKLVGETQQNITFWEYSEKPPRSDVLPKMAKVLGCSVEQLLGISAPWPRRQKPMRLRAGRSSSPRSAGQDRRDCRGPRRPVQAQGKLMLGAALFIFGHHEDQEIAMPVTARDLLIEKIDRLPPARVAEVEDFVDFLASRDTDRELAHAVTAAAVPAFAKVWENPEDDVYNDI